MDKLDTDLDPDPVKKRRGRKPKNFYEEEPPKQEVEKKKRGRKKKYEIENFDKLNNRDQVNNFDHHIAYSDDENVEIDNTKSIKKVSFGNLDITISKSVSQPESDNFKSIVQSQIVENEWETDSEESEQEESYEKVYKENKKYIPSGSITERSNEETVKKIRVVTTLKGVTNFNEWPEKTDIHCWWCCHKFDCVPCTMPTKYDPLRKRFNFTGIFCSWNCVKANNFSINDQLKYQRSELITLLIQKLYGITHAIGIKPAPPRQCLKIFGGYLTIDEFRNNNSGVESYKMNLLNYNFVYPEVTELTNIKSKTVHKNLRIQRS
jgi:hypothetical protein